MLSGLLNVNLVCQCALRFAKCQFSLSMCCQVYFVVRFVLCMHGFLIGCRKSFYVGLDLRFCIWMTKFDI